MCPSTVITVDPRRKVSEIFITSHDNITSSSYLRLNLEILSIKKAIK